MSCRTCHGPGRADCVSCPSRWRLVNGECLSECPAGYYETEGGGCMKCFKGCQDCKGNYT